MTARTRSDIAAAITGNLADNAIGGITPAIVRSVLNDLNDSVFNPLTDPPPAPPPTDPSDIPIDNTAGPLSDPASTSLPTYARLLSFEKANGFVPIKAFGVLSNGTDETTKINTALAQGVVIQLQKALYPISAPLVIGQQGGIKGMGEASYLERRFTGGVMIGYANGEPIILEDFSIGTASGQAVNSGDNGIMLNHTPGSVGWAQRGRVKNLKIGLQWVGFWWRGGTDGPIEQVYSLQNKSHGFQGINPRGRLVGCSANSNAGSGFYLYAANAGETGVDIFHTGTFSNQGWGFQCDSAPGVGGANLYLNACGTSFEGAGGLYVPIAFQHLRVDNFMAEYSGHAPEFQPTFTADTAAPGIFLNHPSIAMTDLRNLMLTNNKGAGARVFGGTVEFSDAIIQNNGNGNSETVGLALSGTTSILGGNLRFINDSATQLTDISVNGNAVSGSLKNIHANTIFNSGTSPIKMDATSGALSNTLNVTGATITVPRTQKMVVLQGATACTTINGGGDELKVLIDTGASLGTGGNIQISSPITDVYRVVYLVRNGANWFQIR